jgi:O-antigen/teichoic acid export membrane protein
VILEALGYKDEDAREMGYRDLFELADAVKDVAAPYAWEEPLTETPRKPVGDLTLYLAGVFYNVGWIIMLIALLLGGQSLWAARDLPVEVSTAIGLGVVMGLVCTGGLQQFTSWKIIYYHMQGNRPLTRFVMRKELVLGGAIVLATAAVVAWVEVAFIGLPSPMAALSALYIVLIGFYRLMVAPVFAMRKFVALIVMSLAALVGMFASYQLLAIAGVGRVLAVVGSQILGLGLLLLVSLAFMVAFIFAEREEERGPNDPPFYAKREMPKKVNPPKFWVLALDGLPYLLYGTMYFVFLFGDRLVSWFGVGVGPFALNYNRSYQIGVDIALLTLVLITAVKYPLVFRLSEYLEKVSREASITDPRPFAKEVARYHNRLTLRVVVASVAFTSVASLLAEPIISLAGGSAESVGVFRLALVGIVLFSIFLSNAVFAMAFRRLGAIAVILLVGTVMNYALSATFALSFGPNLSVLGFLIGSLFLAMASSAYLLKLREAPDYAYYSAA